MTSLLGAGARLQADLEQRGWRFAFIGGVANFRWGTPRLTNDLDLTLLAGFGAERQYAEALLASYASRVTDAAAFAAENRVLLLRTAAGFAVDVALGAMPFEERTIDRSSLAELAPGAILRTCSAEDLVVQPRGPIDNSARCRCQSPERRGPCWRTGCNSWFPWSSSRLRYRRRNRARVT